MTGSCVRPWYSLLKLPLTFSLTCRLGEGVVGGHPTGARDCKPFQLVFFSKTFGRTFQVPERDLSGGLRGCLIHLKAGLDSCTHTKHEETSREKKSCGDRMPLDRCTRPLGGSASPDPSLLRRYRLRPSGNRHGAGLHGRGRRRVGCLLQPCGSRPD